MNSFYSELAAKLNALMEGVPYQIANLANASALLWQELPDINWVGFYQLLGDRLVLGPFQGKPACFGKGRLRKGSGGGTGAAGGKCP